MGLVKEYQQTVNQRAGFKDQNGSADEFMIKAKGHEAITLVQLFGQHQQAASMYEHVSDYKRNENERHRQSMEHRNKIDSLEHRLDEGLLERKHQKEFIELKAAHEVREASEEHRLNMLDLRLKEVKAVNKIDSRKYTGKLEKLNQNKS